MASAAKRNSSGRLDHNEPRHAAPNTHRQDGAIKKHEVCTTARQSEGRAHGGPHRDENPDGVHAPVANHLESTPKAGSTPLKTSAETVESPAERSE